MAGREGKPDEVAELTNAPGVNGSRVCSLGDAGGVVGALSEAARLPTPSTAASEWMRWDSCSCGAGRDETNRGAPRVGGHEAGGAPGAVVRLAPWRPVDGRPGPVRLGRLSEAALADLEMRAIARRPPDSLPRSQANTAVLDGWMSLLSPHFDGAGAVNLTGTYSDGYGQSHGLMLPRNVQADFIRALAHERPRFESESTRFLPWCMGVERHNTGRDVLHFHAMVGGVWTEEAIAALRDYWTSTRGWCVCKPVNDAGGCVAYCAKHLLKRGAADNFDFQLVPKRALDSRHAKRLRTSAR